MDDLRRVESFSYINEDGKKVTVIIEEPHKLTFQEVCCMPVFAVPLILGTIALIGTLIFDYIAWNLP